MIKQIGLVIVPVSDQDAAIDFWTNGFGLELRGDTPYEAMGQQLRWVEVGPAGAETVLALNVPGSDHPQPGQETNVSFVTDDLEADHAALTDRGVAIEEIMSFDGPVPPMAFFRDNDGNRYLLVQRD